MVNFLNAEYAEQQKLTENKKDAIETRNTLTDAE